MSQKQYAPHVEPLRKVSGILGAKEGDETPDYVEARQ